MAVPMEERLRIKAWRKLDGLQEKIKEAFASRREAKEKYIGRRRDVVDCRGVGSLSDSFLVFDSSRTCMEYTLLLQAADGMVAYSFNDYFTYCAWADYFIEVEEKRENKKNSLGGGK